MPFGDRTGPLGLGPMTGRAAGFCAGFPVPGFANPIPGGLAVGRLSAYGYPLGYGAYGYPYGSGAAGYPYAYGAYGAAAPVGYGAGLPYAPYYGGFMRPRLGLGIRRGMGRGIGMGRGMRRWW